MITEPPAAKLLRTATPLAVSRPDTVTSRLNVAGPATARPLRTARPDAVSRPDTVASPPNTAGPLAVKAAATSVALASVVAPDTVRPAYTCSASCIVAMPDTDSGPDTLNRSAALIAAADSAPTTVRSLMVAAFRTTRLLRVVGPDTDSALLKSALPLTVSVDERTTAPALMRP